SIGQNCCIKKGDETA
ncbi:hypothetical protein Tsp_12948, partial [Trichinella spiralis]